MWGGTAAATISACYATGAATATGDNGSAGGLVGNNSSEMVASFCTGDAAGAGRYVGGLEGNNSNSNKITNSYFDSDLSTATGMAYGSAITVTGLGKYDY